MYRIRSASCSEKMYAEFGNPHSQGSMRLPKWRHVFHFQSSSPTPSEVVPWPPKYFARFWKANFCFRPTIFGRPSWLFKVYALPRTILILLKNIFQQTNPPS
ncbi:uncharacterized protein [Gossypium hirsutum]|uniref:Uncharacterized protein n=1 Tax=Gossypium hirsutum TaxID=3635 RepID=A0ABM3BPP7_GOSHI|nr:uncharacterized protein LOC107959250 [Gossypium hirsutum]